MPIVLGQNTSSVLQAMREQSAQAAEATQRLATGLKVDKALDGSAFFTGRNLSARSSVLTGLLDGISNGIDRLETAEHASKGIVRLMRQLDDLVADAIDAKVELPTVVPEADAIDATAQTLLDATGLTLATDVRDLGIDGSTDAYAYVWAGTETPSIHRFLEDGWTVADLIDTINAEADGVTAGLVDGRLALVSQVGGDARIGTGQVASTPGLSGSIHQLPSFFADVPSVEAFIDGRTPEATFTSTSLDYPNGGGDDKANLRLGPYLGADGGSVAGLASNTQVTRMAFVVEGHLDVPADGTYDFTIGSDDGATLYIDDAALLTTDTSGGSSSPVFLSAGLHSIRVVTYENNGTQGLWVESPLSGGAAIGGALLSTPGTLTQADLVIPPPVTTVEEGNEFSIRYDEILRQIDEIARDAGFIDGNVAMGDALEVIINERGSRLETSFGSIDSYGLGLRGMRPSEWLSDPSAVLSRIETAERVLAAHGAQRQAALATLTTRENFTKDLVNVLQAGRDALVLADPNEEGAKLLSVQTRSQLSSTSLQLATAADQSVLRLFR